MSREEGGGFGMGNTCIPVADSCISIGDFKNPTLFWSFSQEAESKTHQRSRTLSYHCGGSQTQESHSWFFH